MINFFRFHQNKNVRNLKDLIIYGPIIHTQTKKSGFPTRLVDARRSKYLLSSSQQKQKPKELANLRIKGAKKFKQLQQHRKSCTSIIKSKSTFHSSSYRKNSRPFHSVINGQKKLNNQLLYENQPKSIRLMPSQIQPSQTFTLFNPEKSQILKQNQAQSKCLKSYKLLKMLGKSYILEDQLLKYNQFPSYNRKFKTEQIQRSTKYNK